jgi:hypothetical protein
VRNFVEDYDHQKTKLGSPHAVEQTLEVISVAAQDVTLSVRRMSSSMAN